jgi:phosphoribosyl-ATP pyrophosphohydrolase
MKDFDQLWHEINEKVATADPSSYSVSLIAEGVHAICKKINEEAGEVWLAAEHEGDEALALEISQLIYHLQLLMVSRKLTPNDIYRRL